MRMAEFLSRTGASRECLRTPGRHAGAEAAEDDGEPFEEKMKRLVATLREQQAEAVKHDAAIAANLKELGYAS